MKQQTLTRNRLANAFQQRLGNLSTTEYKRVVGTLIEVLTEAFKNGRKVEFRDFGIFEVVIRRRKLGRNPKKPQDIYDIPAKRVVKFRVGNKLNRIINGL